MPERVIPTDPKTDKNSRIYLEHCARYRLASQFAAQAVCLDIACGAGYGSELLLNAAAKRVIGADIAPEAAHYAQTYYGQPGIHFLVASGTHIPLPDEAVDLVVSLETIEHIVAYEQFVAEVRRVLRPNGRFVVSTPNVERYVNYPDPPVNPFHVKEFAKQEMRDLLQRHGFGNVTVYGQSVFPGHQQVTRFLRWVLTWDRWRLVAKVRQWLRPEKKVAASATTELPAWSYPPQDIANLEVVPLTSESTIYHVFVLVAQKNGR